MKRNLQSIFAILVFILPAALVGQITVTNSVFPVAGDTLRTVTATDAGDFNPNMTGANLEWDLRGLTNGQAILTTYTETSEGDAAEMFPEADLLDKGPAQEIYYKSFDDKIVEIGRSGLDPVLNAINLSFTNEGESILRRAPMSYEEAYADESSFMIAAPSTVIPDSLFPGLSTLIDSIRLTVETENDDLVDAWGTLRLPDGDYDVLRLKRTTSTNAILEVKAPFIGWSVLDESNPLTAALGDFADLLGITVTTSYQFYGDVDKEILASFTYNDEDTLLTASYKGELSTSTKEINFNDVGVKTYPNPTYGDVTFELSNLPTGEYSIVLYNIIGKKLWSDQFDNNRSSLKANLSHLKKGTYLYSIVDGNGRKVTTKRLMIITP